MRFSVLTSLATVAALSFATQAAAITVMPEPGANLEFFSYSVDLGTRTIVINETWGPMTNSFVDLRFNNFPLGNVPSFTVIKNITNNTGVRLNSFTFELLNADKSSSDNDDGLSFAQNGVPQIPRVSDTFADVFVDELFDRDFIRFSDGVLGLGNTAQFQFGLSLTNREGNRPFFLRQSGTSVIPEPATWAMLITGFGLVGFAMRRRKASIASVAA